MKNKTKRKSRNCLTVSLISIAAIIVLFCNVLAIRYIYHNGMDFMEHKVCATEQTLVLNDAEHNYAFIKTNGYTEHYDLFEGTCAEWKVKHEEYKPTEGFLNVCWGFGCAFVMIEICLLILLVLAIIFSAISECTFIDDIIRWINDGEDR